MKIEIHEDKCVAAGACVMEAFDVFDQRDEDGVVVVTDDNPDPEQFDAVRRAAAACPAGVIKLHD